MPGMSSTMREFRAGTLHSGSKSGPTVTNQKQAIAIGMHEQAAGDMPASLRSLHRAKPLPPRRPGQAAPAPSQP